ncbi:MAG: WbqC family protein [Flavobacteriaceae bacterium]|nr:WbqC family protein [Flavobacteriaceae bacterium]
MTVFSSHYFPSIRYISDFINSENQLIDGFENIQKQTYRNRCYILGPNGRQMLVVPYERKNPSRQMKDMRICYAENWQKEHFKSLEAAYRRSPYFEYYEHYFDEIFNRRFEYLFELNNAILERILKILQAEIPLQFTQSYESVYQKDLREAYSAKEKKIEIPEYPQVFVEKIPFETDLSIIDLICNLGPESIIYLKNLI